jgi:hypothetical protein
MAEYTDADILRIVKVAVREAMAQTVATPREDLSAIAAAAARTAVQEAHVKMWAQLGFNMADLRDVNRLRANLDFLNTFHRSTAAAGAKFLFVAITIIAGALLAAMWIGVKASLHK